MMHLLIFLFIILNVVNTESVVLYIILLEVILKLLHFCKMSCRLKVVAPC